MPEAAPERMFSRPRAESVSGRFILSAIADVGPTGPYDPTVSRVRPSRAERLSLAEASIQATRGRRMASACAALLSRFLCAVVFFAPASAVANAGRADWLVEKVTGSVSVQTDRAWVPLHQDDRVPFGASIKTGIESEIQISRREARLNVASNAKVQFVAAANPKTMTISVELGSSGSTCARRRRTVFAYGR